MKTIFMLIVAASTLVLAQDKSSDAAFVKKASAGGMAEVQMGQLAQQKASNNSVKEFGKRMEGDHTKAGDELKTIASEEGMTISTSMNAKDKALYDRLSNMSGADFDRAYMAAMVRDHQEDMAEFQKEAHTGRNQKIKDFASRTLPTLKEHLNMARSAAAEVGASK